jgi:hypothetical protein
MKVKSFTYERSWTGKYYRQRLLPSMQTMDKHIASMLNDDWKVMAQTPHSVTVGDFDPLRNAMRSQSHLEKLAKLLSVELFAITVRMTVAKVSDSSAEHFPAGKVSRITTCRDYHFFIHQNVLGRKDRAARLDRVGFDDL